MIETKIGPLASIPSGEGRNFSVLGKPIAVFRTREGRVFATQAECPHRRGPLADGLLGGTTLICPLHAWKFDLQTGAPLMGECGIQTFPARVDEEGQILVTVGENFEYDLR